MTIIRNSLLSAMLVTLMFPCVEAQRSSDTATPRPIYSPDPEYSEQARIQHVQGTCVLRVLVGTDGIPLNIRTEKRLGAGLDENAVAAVRNWRFDPAIKDGKPVASEGSVEVTFRLGRSKEAEELLRESLPASIELPITTTIESCPAPSVSAQATPEPQITVAEVAIEGAHQIDAAEQNQIAASIKRRLYFGTPDRAKDEIVELIRDEWENRGFFRVQVEGESTVLSSMPRSSRIAVKIRVEEDQPYLLGGISFRNNKAITNTHALRDLFSLKDGELASRAKIAKGLENLRKAYGTLGYVNATLVPEVRFDDEARLVWVDINVDEGKQFFVSSIDLIGDNAESLAAARKDLLLKPGQVYNQRLLDLFEEQHPVANVSDSETLLHLNEKEGTVDIGLDLRHCQPTLDMPNLTTAQ